MIRKEFYPSFDGLRAMCFIFVFLFHCEIPGFELGWGGNHIFLQLVDF